MSYKFSGKVLTFDLGSGSVRKYIMGAIRYGHLRNYAISEPFNAKTGEGEQRLVIESHARNIKKAMSAGKYSPDVFKLGTRKVHRDELQIKDGMLNLEVTDAAKLPLIDGGNRSHALELLRQEGGATEKAVDNVFIPYLLLLDGNTREDFVNYQAGKPVSRDHMLSVRIANGLLDSKHAPYLEIAKDVANILHNTKDSFCHNLIQSDSSGVKLPLSLNSLCSKGASDIAFSLYGGAKICVNYVDEQGKAKDAKWLSECILTAFRAIQQNPEASTLLERGNILAPVPDGTKAGTSMIIGLGNMLAARLMLRQINEPEDADVQLLVDCAIEHLTIQTRGNTSADRKRQVFKKFVIDFFSDLIADVDDEVSTDDDEEGLDIPTKTIGAHEDIPVALIRLLSPSTFNVSKLPKESKGRKKKKAVVGVSEIDTDTDEVVLDIDAPRVSKDVDVDAEAFADMDAASKDALRDLEAEAEDDDDELAPWDD